PKLARSVRPICLPSLVRASWANTRSPGNSDAHEAIFSHKRSRVVRASVAPPAFARPHRSAAHRTLLPRHLRLPLLVASPHGAVHGGTPHSSSSRPLRVDHRQGATRLPHRRSHPTVQPYARMARAGVVVRRVESDRVRGTGGRPRPLDDLGLPPGRRDGK